MRTMADTKNILITGATGMVGGEALNYALGRDDVTGVTALVRRPTGVTHGKLNEIVHDDFMDYKPVANHFENITACAYCVGVYTGAVPGEEFARITVDYSRAFSDMLREKSPGAALSFLSGGGADSTEKSRILFAREKGKAENIFRGAGFSRVHVLRPGYIYPVTPRREPNMMYRVSRFLWEHGLGRIAPGLGISSRELGRAMVDTALDGAGREILENTDIRRFLGI